MPCIEDDKQNRKCPYARISWTSHPSVITGYDYIVFLQISHSRNNLNIGIYVLTFILLCATLLWCIGLLVDNFDRLDSGFFVYFLNASWCLVHNFLKWNILGDCNRRILITWIFFLARNKRAFTILRWCTLLRLWGDSSRLWCWQGYLILSMTNATAPI